MLCLVSTRLGLVGDPRIDRRFRAVIPNSKCGSCSEGNAELKPHSPPCLNAFLGIAGYQPPEIRIAIHTVDCQRPRGRVDAQCETAQVADIRCAVGRLERMIEQIVEVSPEIRPET